MKKQITAFALTLAIGCSLLTSCGQQPVKQGSSSAKPASSTAAATTNEVNVWAWDTNFNIPIIKLAGDYYAKDGHENFKVNVTEMSNDDTKAKMTAAFTSGTTDGLPDIVLIEDYDAQSFLQNYEGKFLDLTDEIDFSEFASYKVDAVTYQDRTFAIPFDSGVAGMYYRADYLEQAGYTAADMQNLTWTQFIQIGKDVKEKTGKWMISILPYRSTHYINMAMQSAGSWYFDESGNINLKNNPAVREMCGVLKEISAANIANPVEYYSAEAHGSITSGETAAAITAIWYAPTIKSAEDQTGKWAYTNLPILETVENATPYSNIGGSSWYILADSPNKEAALAMMKTVFAGNNEFYNDILKDRGAVSAYLPSKTVPAYNEVDAFFKTPIYQDFAKWMDKVPGVSYGTNTQLAMDSIRAVMQDYFDEKLTLDEMLTQAEEQYTMQAG